MERSLRLDRLNLALGGPPDGRALPSAAELQELLAETEIRLVMRQPSVEADLVEAAWYLHGVASVASRLGLYTVERQRSAFQVSAHVFDLALAGPNESTRDRLEFGLAAQLGYQRGGLEPNAIAIYQRLKPLIREDRLLEHVDLLPLEVGVALLGFERRQLFSWMRTWKSQLAELGRQIQHTLDGTMFGPPASVVHGADSILRYLTRGDVSALARGRQLLAGVVTDEEADLTTRWVASQLCHVAAEVEQGSVWSVLPDNVPRAAREAMTLTEPGILTLWEPQRELVKHEPNPLANDVRRVVMSLPTSAGKTLLAQLLMVSHLATQRTSVCYVAPLRSLGREVRRAIRTRLHLLQKELAPDLPDVFLFESVADMPEAELQALEDAIRGEQADVDVMTPERLAHMLRQDPDAVLQKYGLFVFDEAHLVGDASRGFTFEWVISYLHWRTLNTDHRLVLLSAALGNRGQVQQWIDPAGAGVLFESDWRGPRRLHAIYRTDVDWNTRQEVPFASRGFRSRAVYPLVGRIRVRLAEGARDHRLQIVEPVGTFARRVSDAGVEEQGRHNSTTAFYRTVAQLATAVAHGGPVLLVTSTRPAARRMAQAIAALLPDDPEARGVAQFARLRLGDAHPLVPVLQRGVAYHHAGLPVDVLEAIEDALGSDEVKFIASTTTLTEGVNLPVRTVILAETVYDGQPVEALLRGARMLNAMGRAGRACRESEGWIFLARNDREQPNDFDALQVGDDDLRVESRLASEDALVALAALEERVRAQEDLVFSETAREVTDFIAFVWFVLAAEESLGREPFEARVADALGATLGFAELGDDDRRRYVTLATNVRNTYARTDPAGRRRWVRSGTSVRSARTIDGVVELVVRAAGGFDEIDDPHVALRVLGEADAFTSLLNLPEAPGRWRFKTTETGQFHEIDVSPRDLLDSWVSGMSVTELAWTYLEGVRAEDYRVEQMVDMVTQFFEHFLSWTVGAVVILVNERLLAEERETFLCPPLHLFIRYGVNSMHAVDLLVRGVRSREFATRVAEQSLGDGVAQDQLRMWLGDLSIAQWRHRFDASAPDLVDLLEYTRARRGGLLRVLLEEGIASVDVTVPQPAPEVKSVTIQEDRGERPAALVLVDADSNDALGHIPTPTHADIEAALRTGLPLSVQLQWTTLTIRLLDE